MVTQTLPIVEPKGARISFRKLSKGEQQEESGLVGGGGGGGHDG